MFVTCIVFAVTDISSVNTGCGGMGLSVIIKLGVCKRKLHGSLMPKHGRV